jgi:beta-phosphoglucomutase-like phosphatase (HAD superfamily)
MNKMVVKGFIFDIDDTLVDSKEVHYQSWEYVLEKYKISIKKEDVIKEFGNATNKIGLKFANGDIELGNKLANEKTEHLISNINKIQPFSGVNELFKRIIENKCTIAIASSNSEKLLKQLSKLIIGINLSVFLLVLKSGEFKTRSRNDFKMYQKIKLSSKKLCDDWRFSS